MLRTRQTYVGLLSTGLARRLRRQLHHQWMLIPDQIRLLVRPLPTFIFQAQVEVPQDLCHDDPHFQMCETVAK